MNAKSEFEKYLKWKYGLDTVTVSNSENITEAKIVLTSKQSDALNSIKTHNNLENFKDGSKNTITRVQHNPLIMGTKNSCILHADNLILSGSDMFIEYMLAQIVGEKEICAETEFVCPIDERIRSTYDDRGFYYLMRYIRHIENDSADIEELQKDYIPVELLTAMSNENLILGKKKLFISIGFTYRDLRRVCTKYDKARYNGESSVLCDEYRNKCVKLQNEIMKYLDIIGW